MDRMAHQCGEIRPEPSIRYQRELQGNFAIQIGIRLICIKLLARMLRALVLIFLCALSPGLMAGSWNDQFVPPPGIAGDVSRTVVYRQELIVGGDFARANGVAATNLARWDGTNWHPFAGGVNGRVGVLAVSGTNLFVGGSFDRAGGLDTTNLAVWNGSEWHSIGSVSGSDYNSPGPANVFTILPVTNGVYVAGLFREAGGVAATNIAFWDGTSWHPVGGGIGNEGGQVHSLAMYRGELYAGGIFRDADHAPRTNMARWNGQEWLPVGGGVTEGDNQVVFSGQVHFGVVYSLTVYRNMLCVGGNFFHAGKVRTTSFAMWNGRRWMRLGRGVSGARRSVNHLESTGRRLFVGGSFNRFSGHSFSNIATLPFSTQRRFKEGVDATLGSIVVLGRDLFVGGEFGSAGRVSALGVARWDGKQWSALGEGVGNAPQSIPFTVAASGSNVFVAGYLTTAGTNRVNGVAQWDGHTWHPLGGGIPDGQFRASAANGSNFYVSGGFALPSIGATNLAHWDGTRWRSLGVVFDADFGLAGSVLAMEFAQGKLYVAGRFTTAGSVAAKNVACWDGTNWMALGDGLPLDVQAPSRAGLMAYHDGNLYVVSSIIGNPPNRIAAVWRWDGTNWAAIGRCANYWEHVIGISVFHGELYVAGQFSGFGGIQADNLARWDGTNWAGVGSQSTTADGSITTISATTNALYLGGGFSMIAGMPARSVARWDGNEWSGVGKGLSDRTTRGYPLDSAGTDSSVFFVGFFDSADDKPSHHMAEWRE